MTEKTILTINCGSSSIKFALFAATEGLDRRYAGAVERIGLKDSRLWAESGAGERVFEARESVPDHAAALDGILFRLDESGAAAGLAAVGHRIVHGGAGGVAPEIITPETEARLKGLVSLAPLHMPHNMAGVAGVRARRPDLVQVACYDTAFHRTMPRLAQLTGLPGRFAEEGIRRYGFHGISCEYVLDDLGRREGPEAARQRLIIAHLGNGASMTAVKDGGSVDTTMGFSTLAGLVMGTRCGDLDPGIVLHLLTERGMSASEVATLLYRESGLLGVSGISRNMADLVASKDARAAEAVDLFCYRARRQMAALTAALGGLDRIIFTGGMGANAPAVRAQILMGLDYLGIALDETANARRNRRLSRDDSAVVIDAVPTDEERMIARHTRTLIAGAQS